MDYDAFKECFLRGIEGRGLTADYTSETLHLEHMTRDFKLATRIRGREFDQPLDTLAEIRWSWTALNSARANASEEELIGDVVPRASKPPDTVPPYLKIHIDLRLIFVLPAPMPSQTALKQWAAAMFYQLLTTAPPIPINPAYDDNLGGPLARIHDLGVEACCDTQGRMMLKGLCLPSWQILFLPRQWESPKRQDEPPPTAEIAAIWERIEAALRTWTDLIVLLYADDGATQH